MEEGSIIRRKGVLVLLKDPLPTMEYNPEILAESNRLSFRFLQPSQYRLGILISMIPILGPGEIAFGPCVLHTDASLQLDCCDSSLSLHHSRQGDEFDRLALS